MKTIKTEAIVIGRYALPNRDQILIFLTPALGKIKVFAKGIKKITSRRLSHLDTGNLLNILLTKKNENLYLQQTELISGFSELKRNMKKISYLYFFLFIINKILPDNQTETEVYQLTKRLLIFFGQKNRVNQQVLLDHLNQLLIILGYSTKPFNWLELKDNIEKIINEKLPPLEYN